MATAAPLLGGIFENGNVAKTHPNLRTLLHVTILRYRIRDDNRLKARIVDPRNGRTRKDTVGQNSIDFSRTSLHQPKKKNNLQYLSQSIKVQCFTCQPHGR